jgi:CBS domain-containing protein
MHDEQIYRLVVLDDDEHRKLAGVISLGDIIRHGQQDLAARTVQGIAS